MLDTILEAALMILLVGVLVHSAFWLVRTIREHTS
jgi:hypothetical protein